MNLIASNKMVVTPLRRRSSGAQAARQAPDSDFCSKLRSINEVSPPPKPWPRRIKNLFAVLGVLLFLMVHGAVAQVDINANSPRPAPMSKLEKKALKKKEKRAAKVEKAEIKGKKRHAKLQTKDVQKRMKKSKKTAARNNAHKRDFFLTRWFTRKHNKTSR